MNPRILGILGGLGPMSGVYFCEMLTAHTKADCDQQHLNFVLSSYASTPDRTDFILGRSSDNPLPDMLAALRRLERADAELIAIPCNTAHYFYQSISDAATVPVINIIDQTVAYCKSCGYRRVGVLATEGTILSGAYESVLHKAGLTYVVPSKEDQATVSRIIYEQIKKGLPPDREAFERVVAHLLADGCDTVILGCTELSLLKRSFGLGTACTDSMEVLACAAIRLCGKTPVGFDDTLMKFIPHERT